MLFRNHVIKTDLAVPESKETLERKTHTPYTHTGARVCTRIDAGMAKGLRSQLKELLVAKT